jgi:hypothetical protein
MNALQFIKNGKEREILGDPKHDDLASMLSLKTNRGGPILVNRKQEYSYAVNEEDDEFDDNCDKKMTVMTKMKVVMIRKGE